MAIKWKAKQGPLAEALLEANLDTAVDIAEATGLHRNTIKRALAGTSLSPTTARAITRAVNDRLAEGIDRYGTTQLFKADAA